MLEFTREVAFTLSTKIHLWLPRKPFQTGKLFQTAFAKCMWSLPVLKSDIAWNLLSLREWTSRSSCVGPACVRVVVAGKLVWWKPQDDSCNGCSSCFSLVKLLARSKSRNCLPCNLLTTLVARKWMETSNLSEKQNKNSRGRVVYGWTMLCCVKEMLKRIELKFGG